MNTLYTATAVATGDGRNGHVQTFDGNIDAPVRTPKELGGEGGATNPEQLFAAGYAACFHSALKLVAGAMKVDITDSEVVADVSSGRDDNGAFALSVRLEVALPAVEPRRWPSRSSSRPTRSAPTPTPPVATSR